MDIKKTVANDAAQRAALAERHFDAVGREIRLAKQRGLTSAASSVALILDPKDTIGRQALEAVGPACGLDVAKLDERTVGVVVVPRDVVRKAMTKTHPGIVAKLEASPPTGLFWLVTISHGGATLAAVPDVSPAISQSN